MIIKLYDIKDRLSVKGELDGAAFKRPEDVDISFPSPIAYDLTIEKAGDSFWVHGQVSATLSLTCARCLEPFAQTVVSQLDIELLPKSATPELSDVELKTEELDAYYFEGDEVDIDPYVFEEIMLNLPLKALCSESCKGICPSCGKNLNVEDCGCEKTGSTILAEQLKSFLKDR